MVSGSQRMEIRQGQSLVMTPQLQQSLKILQLSTQDLQEYIEQELEKNPLLAIEENTEQKEDKGSDKSNNESAENDPLPSPDSFEQVNDSEISSDKDNGLDTSASDIWEDSGDFPTSQPTDFSSHSSDSGYDYDSSYYEKVIAEETTLREHITDQINLDFTDIPKKITANHLLDMLDDNGYISGDFSALAEALNCEESFIEEILERLQKLDPPGIFARSLSECLALQLKDKNRYDPAMQKLVENLDLMGKGELDKLQKICGVTKEDLLEMCIEIRELNPRPGNIFNPEVTQEVHPDVFVRKAADGEWEIELNSDTLPRVLVNNKYYRKIRQDSKKDEEKKYISEQYNNASWLVRALNQRAETIMKVTEALVKRQQDFFEKGIYHLRPLIMRDIAEEIDMHESTVARVTSNKYISTSRGIFEMRYFFSSSIGSAQGGEDFSSKTVKHLIAELIEEETADNVLSDEKIAEILQERGVNVARRTVAKYRESMKIPSSAQRKRQKRLMA